MDSEGDFSFEKTLPGTRSATPNTSYSLQVVKIKLSLFWFGDGEVRGTEYFINI